MSQAYPDERVLVIRRSLFDELGDFHGFSAETDRYLPAILSAGNNFFLDRALAEDDPGYKQIIPYAVFHHAGRYLRYVRGRKSGEQRLAAKSSIGIGGHINAEDQRAASLERDLYMTGVEREVGEELDIAAAHTQRIVGLINDDTNPVGRVHLGVVHLFDLDSPAVAPNEEGITGLSFLTLEELQADESLETWSQICVSHLQSVFSRT